MKRRTRTRRGRSNGEEVFIYLYVFVCGERERESDIWVTSFVRQRTINLLDGATWFGCGKHVPTAMSNSPKDEWCTCQSSTGAELNGFPPKLGDAVAAKSSED